MIQGTFGPATIESGANKGKPRTLTYKTSIKSENANGLPLKDGVAIVVVNQADIPVSRFSDRAEVERFAGENFDAFVLDAANERMERKTTGRLVTAFKKATLAASNWSTVIASTLQGLTPESIFAPSENVSGKVAKASVVELYNNASLSDAEKLAAIMALVNK